MVFKKKSPKFFPVILTAASCAGAACSLETFTAGSLSKSTASKGTPATSPTPKPANSDEAEIPAVDVAGVNLTGSCFMLASAGQAPDTNSAMCTLRTAGPPAEIEFSNPTLNVGSDSTPLISHSRSGKTGTVNPKVSLVASDSPVSFNFDVPKKMVKDISFSKSQLSFESMTVAGKPATAKVVMNLPLQRLDTSDICAGLPKPKQAVTKITYDISSPQTIDTIVNPSIFLPSKDVSLLHSRVYLKPDKTWASIAPNTPLDKIKICSAEFVGKLVVKWGENDSESETKTHFISMDKMLIYAGSQTLNGFADIHENSKMGWVYNQKYIDDKVFSMNTQISVFNPVPWCTTGSSYCKFKNSEGEESLDLSKTTNQSLRLAAKNVLAGIAGSGMTLTVYDLVKTPGTSAFSSSGNRKSENVIEKAETEFKVDYTVLP
ncbi:MAG: hypothetical protein EBR09_13020 [Proteobacteria bacterium]|nr:hypothetical protein [Pseudomonadota bacterium]